MHKIFKLCGSPSDDCWKKLHLPRVTVFGPAQHCRGCIEDAFKELPPVAVRLMEVLLSVDPSQRGTASLALRNEVLPILYLMSEGTNSRYSEVLL